MQLSPDFKTFKRLAKKGNLVALSASVPADLETPVSSFLKLAAGQPNAFLLESAEQEEKIGRYSFMGFEPELVLSFENNKVFSRGKTAKIELPYAHITDAMKEQLSAVRLANPESLPGFAGGFVGFFSYENVRDFETLKLRTKRGPSIPEAIFFRVQKFLVFDHFRKHLSAVILVPTDGKKLNRAYHAAEREAARMLARLRRPLSLASKKSQTPSYTIQSNLTRASFCGKVKRIKDYIRAGDCIQVVLSQRFSLPHVADDFRIYRALRSVNPSPYMFYFRAGKYRLIGSSPELLVKKTGSLAEVRPIAGTRPRGEDAARDMAHEENLKKSKKEIAEHLMLVDLGRNDLGRVCSFNTVKVKNFMRVERYSHVMHLVSDVQGRLKPGIHAFELLRAVFPAGTVSGAPKIRAMQIIDELEPEQRGPYAGCLGYFAFNGDMDMCITIRTLVCDGRKTYLQAGAGIVKDSVPDKEYQETLNKARALLKAFAMQGEF